MNIGPLNLPTPFCQAGLAGYSDRAMRTVARRRGCAYAVTEALLDTILLNGGQGLRKSIDISDEDHLVAGQIMGSEPGQMADAAKIIANSGFDVVDLNFACPVKKIKNKARGGHMLLDADRGLAVLRAVRDALPAKVPTTISLRKGFDDSDESRQRFFQLVDAAFEHGYSAVRVHGRTVEQKYAGAAHWPFLKEVKQRYPHRTILGSGDVFTAQDAVRMLRETGVDIVWIARGAIGNPWIFRQAAELWKDPDAIIHPPTIGEQREALAEHFELAMQIHGESLAGRRMRKMGIKYSRFHRQSPAVKTDFINVQSLRDWMNVLDRWYSNDGPGIWPDEKAADEMNAAGDLQSCEVTVG